MKCPFLQETQVKTCRASEFRKLIVLTPFPVNELCSTPGHIRCLAAQHRGEDAATGQKCGYLQEMHVQYCSAAPVKKFIPYSESLLSRCGNESHRYCDLYLSLSSPAAINAKASATAPTASRPGEVDDQAADEYLVEDISVPGSLAYSANHMWLDVDSDGCCHLGIDDFLAKVLGHVEKLSFLPTKSGDCPSAVLTAWGTDLQIVFPNHMVSTVTNTCLRVYPEKLTTDPYTLGWLFEGRSAGDSLRGSSTSASSGLLRGKKALEWMESEVARLSEFVRDQIAPLKSGHPLMTDGGTFSRGLIRYLPRDKVLHLFNEFFSPYSGWRQKS